MRCLLLAGGLGSRLYPFSELIPKCLLPIAGIPCAYRIAKRMIDRGFTDVVICINAWMVEQFTFAFRDLPVQFSVSAEPLGCLPSDVEVLTSEGTKPISTIMPNDYVFSLHEKRLVKRKVIGVFPQGKAEVFKLQLPGRSIEATPNHPFLCLDHGKHYWRRLDRLKIGKSIIVADYVEDGSPLRLPEVKKNQRGKNFSLPKYTTDDFMKFLGFFIGDGYVKKDNRFCDIYEVALCEPKSGRYRQKYIELIERLFGCSVSTGGRDLYVPSSQLGRLLVQLGLNKRAKEKEVPSWVSALPITQRLAFVEGYCDADGHRIDKVQQRPFATFRYRAMRFQSASEKLIQQLHNLCAVSGLRPTNIYTKKNEGQIEGRKISGTSFIFLSKIAPKSKKSPVMLSKVKSISLVGVKEVYDLQVEIDHNFLANGIIVHNTAGEIWQAWKTGFLLNEKFLVQYGDDLTEIEYGEVLELHELEKADATLASTTNIHAEVGMLEVDSEGHVTKFMEKPLLGKPCWTSVAVLEPIVLNYLKLGLDLGKDVFPKMLDDGKRICVYQTDADWMDIGNISHWLRANEVFSSNSQNV